jgi:glycerophosphoryl diester phosphodiesterase
MSRVPLLPDRPRPLIFAHRGCSSLAPENTLAAFALARRLGAPGLELDVHRCATGELVVSHDATFRRCAGVDRRVADLSLAEIRGLDVGSWFDPAFAGERPPLLAEVLAEFAGDLYVDIEMKTDRTGRDPLPEALAELLRGFGEPVRRGVTVSSFNPLALRRFKALVPEVATAVIYCAAPEVPWYLRRGQGRWIAGCDYLKPVHTQARARAAAPRRGRSHRPLVAWTVDDPARARELLDQGCAGIVTNRPQDMTAAGTST